MPRRSLASAHELWHGQGMLVTCPHCQGYNEIEPGQPGLITCRICGQDFSPGHDPLFGDDDAMDEITAIGPTRNQSRAIMPEQRGNPFSHTSPPPSVDFANLTGDNFEALRDFGAPTPSVDFDQVTRSDVADLSLLMKPDAESPGADEEESTVAVPAELAHDLAAQLKAVTGAPSPAAPMVWRVRSARGLVYELMSLDAVVAWLEGKADISGVRIARGQGEFQTISSHPELAERFGGRTSGPADMGLANLPLTLDERPITTSAPPQMGAEVSPLRSDPSDAPQRAARADDPAHPIGFAGVLGVAILCAAIIGGAIVFGMRSGWLEEMIPPAPAVAEQPVPATLQAAIDLYEANNLTAAVRALQTEARASNDPRAYRYLAMALHQQKRHQEARDALAQYQQAVDPD